MGQTFNTFISGTTPFGNFFDNLMANLNTLKSAFAGDSAPSNPSQGQLWVKTNAGSIEDIKRYSGNVALGDAGWVPHSFYDAIVQAVKAELESARGSAASLDARLDVAINEDGTLKGDAPASGWWTEEPDPVAYASASTFEVDGDKTAIYLEGRAIKHTQTSDATGHVTVQSTYSGGSGKTTVTVDCTVDSGLTSVEYGQPPNNDPKQDSATTSSPGPVELADSDETEAGTDTERAVTPGALGDHSAVVAAGVFAYQNNLGAL